MRIRNWKAGENKGEGEVKHVNGGHKEGEVEHINGRMKGTRGSV